MLGIKETLTKVLDFMKVKTGTVSTTSSLGFTVKKQCGIVTICCSSGTVTASASTAFATIEDGFRPAFNVDVASSAGGYRVQIATDGTITCTSALSNTTLRFTLTYIVGGYSLIVFSALSRLVRGWEYVRSENTQHEDDYLRGLYTRQRQRLHNYSDRLYGFIVKCCSLWATNTRHIFHSEKFSMGSWLGSECWNSKIGIHSSNKPNDLIGQLFWSNCKRNRCCLFETDVYNRSERSRNCNISLANGLASERGWSCA